MERNSKKIEGVLASSDGSRCLLRTNTTGKNVMDPVGIRRHEFMRSAFQLDCIWFLVDKVPLTFQDKHTGSCSTWVSLIISINGRIYVVCLDLGCFVESGCRYDGIQSKSYHVKSQVELSFKRRKQVHRTDSEQLSKRKCLNTSNFCFMPLCNAFEGKETAANVLKTNPNQWFFAIKFLLKHLFMYCVVTREPKCYGIIGKHV